MLLAPRLYLLAYRTRTRHQRDEPHTLLQAQPQRAFTIGLLSATRPRTPSRPRATPFLKRYGGSRYCHWYSPWRRPIRNEAVTAHAETQEHVLAIITPIFAVPIRRTRRDGPCAPVGFLLIGPIEGERRRILGQPGRREGLDLQGVECDRPKHAVQIHRKQPIEDLPQPVIMERGTRQVRLE